MEIRNNYSLNFKAQKYPVKRKNLQNECSTLPMKRTPVSALKAYNLIDDKKEIKGIKGANITTDYDSTELVYKLKSPFAHSNKVKFI